MRNLVAKTTRIMILVVALINILIYTCIPVLASEASDFEKHMQDWTEKKELASKYLLKAEEEFKAGDELSACATQKEASEFGIAATESLIAAMKINGTMDSFENLEAGLNKWKEIGSLCSSFFN